MAQIERRKSQQRLLSYAEVAERLAVAKSTLYEMVRRGQLPVG